MESGHTFATPSQPPLTLNNFSPFPKLKCYKYQPCLQLIKTKSPVQLGKIPSKAKEESVLEEVTPEEGVVADLVAEVAVKVVEEVKEVKEVKAVKAVKAATAAKAVAVGLAGGLVVEGPIFEVVTCQVLMKDPT
ncbi:hypothetical protein PCASD_14267 [Puccinia coronata f. sp. avenae]|uniref:Uncharacterized protein n=1 Tax=Puccinia coronata f. sp. avenae TaxID=200324 RepID=A0A2N5TF26_9BASI|nr:hypothetical protein PCASD_14267 [Puccinia coronata f. sp. avenae]